MLSTSVLSTEMNVFTALDVVVILVLSVLLQHWIVRAVASSGSGRAPGQ